MNKIPPLINLFMVGCVLLVGIGLFAVNGLKGEMAKADVVAIVTDTAEPTMPTATNTPNRAVETKEWAEAELAILNVTVEAGKVTETAQVGKDAATSTAQAGWMAATETAVIYRTQNAPTLAAIDLTIQTNIQNANNQQKANEIEAFLLGAVWPMIWRVVLLVFGLVVFWKFLKFVKERMEYEEEAEQEQQEENQLNRIEVKRENRLNFYAIPCSDKKLIEIAYGVIVGKKSFTYDEWTPLEKGFSRGQWKLIVAEMLAAGLIEFQNGSNDENGYKISMEGWGYFAKIHNLHKPPTPLLDEDAPEQPPYQA